jgi:hypothetical protein
MAMTCAPKKSLASLNSNPDTVGIYVVTTGPALTIVEALKSTQ